MRRFGGNGPAPGRQGMADRCPTHFDETMISGHLDGELTQAAQQKVRVHLEDCERCRTVLDELRRLREATISTDFHKPDDDQWDERPRSGPSFVARGIGWIIAVVWAVFFAAYALWQFWSGTTNLVERLLVFGGLSALALLFISVLLDRLQTARSDPYREVEK
jgi:anti-sigma factor RsiW